jgi:hypothetical protein
MADRSKFWVRRHAERTDISTFAVHLIRPPGGEANNTKAVDVLMTILKEKRLRGSDGSGFIHGSRPAVCFQDTPMPFIAQNLWFEKKYRDDKLGSRVRYLACGLVFEKAFLYSEGARPVIYDDPTAAKQYLPQDQWWRIVRFDLSDQDKMVDWTHEREWRLPGDLEFDLSQVFVLLGGPPAFHRFIDLCREDTEVDILKSIQGIISLPPLLY